MTPRQVDISYIEETNITLRSYFKGLWKTTPILNSWEVRWVERTEIPDRPTEIINNSYYNYTYVYQNKTYQNDTYLEETYTGTTHHHYNTTYVNYTNQSGGALYHNTTNEFINYTSLNETFLQENQRLEDKINRLIEQLNDTNELSEKETKSTIDRTYTDPILILLLIVIIVFQVVLFIQRRKRKKKAMVKEEPIEEQITYIPPEPIIQEQIYTQEPAPYPQQYQYAPAPEMEQHPLKEPQYQIPQASPTPQLPPRPPRVVSTEPEKEEGLDGINSILKTLEDKRKPTEPSMALPEHKGRTQIEPQDANAEVYGANMV